MCFTKMSPDKKQKIILIATILIELIIGFIFLFNYYQRKIVHKTQDLDKVAVINKENLIFPEESEFKYYYELKPNVVEIESPEWLGYQAKYTYNADGLNERFDYEIEKPANTFRIITLGDSFTFGHYVDTKDNWTEQLEETFFQTPVKWCDYDKVEVINLGMAGWDIPYIVKRYQEIGAKYHPDLIIWFESGSGFTRLNELLRPIINSYAEECQRTSTHGSEEEINYACQEQGWLKSDQEIRNKYSDEEIEQIIINHLDKFFAGLREEKVLFFTLETDVFDDRQKNVLEEWKKRYSGISFLSIVPNIYDLRQTLADGHPSMQGHKIIASSIYEYLENNVINQCE